MTGPAPRTRIYLDYNATTPPRVEARDVMLRALETAGNASSVHAEGRASRALIEEARARVAGLVGADPRNVVFTSGATEAANLALTTSLRDAAGPVCALLTSAVEHPCVLIGHRFPEAGVRVLSVDSAGRLDLDVLADALARVEARPLLALQAANNETGTIQPVAEAVRLVHEKGGLVVCDAVQWAGRGDCRLASLGVDVLFISSHKIGGPQGAGAIAFAHGGLHIDEPLIRGGGQERGARAGTENVAAIAGFGAAAEVVAREALNEPARLRALRDRLEAELVSTIEGIQVFGAEADRLPNTSAFAVGDVSAETLLMALDIEGFALSSGSACSSGKVKASHVLAAMGVEAHMSRGALRVSLGWGSGQGDVDRFCATFQKTLRTIRARRAGLPARN